MNNELSPEFERVVDNYPYFFLETGHACRSGRPFVIRAVIDIRELPPVMWGNRELLSADDVRTLAETAIQALKLLWKQTDTTREEMRDEVLLMLWDDEDFEEDEDSEGVTSEQ